MRTPAWRRNITVLGGAFTLLITAAALPAQADAPPSVLTAPLQHAYLANAVIGYRTAGTGTPLVLISGSGQTMAAWDPRMLDQLALTRQVIVFDNRGVGTSTGPVAGLTIAQMARDTAQLIAQVTPNGKADVLGWSMGSYIAQELAINAPTRVRRLVLASADCGGPNTVEPTKAVVAILVDPQATSEQRMSILFPADQMAAAAQWQAAAGEAFAANHYQPENTFTVPATTSAAQSIAAGPGWLDKGRGTCARLGRITQPTLVGLGKQDAVVPSPNHLALMSGIPHATLRMYFDAGHAFLFQPALGFTAEVATFLS